MERVVFEDDDDFRRVGGLDNDGEEDDEENPQQGGGKLVRASSNDRQQQQQGRKRKRKRGRREDDQSNGLKVPGRPQLPALWDRKLHKSGSSAVVVFVDRQSAVSALRAVRSVRAKEKVKGQEERKIIWRPEKGLRVGVERKFTVFGSILLVSGDQDVDYWDNRCIEEYLTTLFIYPQMWSKTSPQVICIMQPSVNPHTPQSSQPSTPTSPLLPLTKLQRPNSSQDNETNQTQTDSSPSLAVAATSVAATGRVLSS